MNSMGKNPLNYEDNTSVSEFDAKLKTALEYDPKDKRET